jgi:hypothetical protein
MATVVRDKDHLGATIGGVRVRQPHRSITS